ncbi:prolipoprotein diacylglyceryl transferase [Gordonia neofelifaecis NRRL B-59395]|uniref:Phosphatidylglycerol--prolipoprotein diacylglyceryl transferase n=1 Tax=Gordonia neofelifaecis NRRL B-59395 TaxID=644548 RepID=F1YH24_9ACTN|nr:prolipoprotein diacylglyceryl transferase [Gordonia neofelifaecis NRRL B-59395]
MWHLGPVPIRAYALFIIIGIIVAVWWGSRRWMARGGQPGEVIDVALWAVPFGLIGGRIYHVLTDWNTYFGPGGRGLGAVFKIWDGGLGIWGAVAFGAVGAWIGARNMGIKLPPFGDAIAPAILLAQGIGRLGNYFNQELFGRPTTVPWGLEIYDRTNADGVISYKLIDGVSTGTVYSVVHPTFLYELLWNVFFVIVLVLVDRRFRIGHGRLFALYVAGYCVGRFVVELMRDDYATHIFGVRINVFTAAIVFLCAALYFVMAPKGREQGLSMYWPDRAEELAAEGAVGYVPQSLSGDEDVDDAEQYDEDGPGGDEPGYEDAEYEEPEYEESEYEESEYEDDADPGIPFDDTADQPTVEDEQDGGEPEFEVAATTAALFADGDADDLDADDLETDLDDADDEASRETDDDAAEPREADDSADAGAEPEPEPDVAVEPEPEPETDGEAGIETDADADDQSATAESVSEWAQTDKQAPGTDSEPEPEADSEPEPEGRVIPGREPSISESVSAQGYTIVPADDEELSGITIIEQNPGGSAGTIEIRRADEAASTAAEESADVEPDVEPDAESDEVTDPADRPSPTED